MSEACHEFRIFCKLCKRSYAGVSDKKHAVPALVRRANQKMTGLGEEEEFAASSCKAFNRMTNKVIVGVLAGNRRIRFELGMI